MMPLAGFMIAMAISARLPDRVYDGCPGSFVFFKPDSARLDQQARVILSNSAIWMIQAVHEGRGGTWVEIVASSDEGETAPGNRRLSQRRANSVRDFLVGRGIRKDFIRATGGGLGSPLLAGLTPAQGRATERRAEAGLG